MIMNERWADNVVQMLSERLATATGEDLTLLLKEILLYRGQSHLWATKAAPFFHPQLADVTHDHRREDGKPIVPIIEITGYPEAKQIEQLAQHEREAISARTKAALAAAKRRGVKLGGDRGVRFSAKHVKLAVAARREKARARAADLAT